MSITARDWAWEQEVPASAKLVLLALAERADEKGVCWPSMGELAKRCGMTRPTVFYHLGRLTELGVIARERRDRGDGSLTSNRYYLGVRDISNTVRDQSDTGARDIEQGARPALQGARPALQRTEPSVTVTPSFPVPSEPPKTRAAQPAKKPKPPFDLEAVTAELVTLYADRWPEAEVRERIAYAMQHKKGGPSWGADKSIGLTRWLREDAKREDERRATRGTAPPYRNGTGPAPPGDIPNRVQEDPSLRAKVFDPDHPDQWFKPPKQKGQPP